jgi:hypothetical protein
MESSKSYIADGPLWKITVLRTGKVIITDNRVKVSNAANVNVRRAIHHLPMWYEIEAIDSPAAHVLYSPKTDNE